MTDLLRILARQVRSDRGVAALLALVVLATVGLTTASLRLTDRAVVDDVRLAVDTLAPARRDLTGVLEMPVDASVPVLVPPALDEAAARLGDLAGAPVWSMRLGPLTAEARPGVDNIFSVRLGPGWQDRMRLVAGSLPVGARGLRAEPVAGVEQRPRVLVIDVALTRAAAEAMSVRLGQTVDVAAPSTYAGSDLRLRVVGLLEPIAPADPFWADDPQSLAARVTFRDPRSTVEGTVFAGTEALETIASSVSSSVRLGLRVPVRPEVVAVRPMGDVIDAVRRTNATLVPVTPDVGGVRLDSALVPTLLAERARRAPLLALTAVLIAVLLAAAVGAVVLAARLLVHRRSGALALARARGASGGQLLGALAGEGLLLGVPPALLAAYLAGLVPDGGVRAEGGQGWRLLLAVAVGLTPAVALAGSGLRLVAGGPVGAGGSAARRLAARHGSTAALVLLVAAAALAALGLRSRGVAAATAPTDAAGADLLVVVAPVLVAAAVAVLVARGVGPLLTVVVSLLARLRGGVVFLGAARAARERSAAGVALVAMALTVTAGMLGATADATVRDGTTVATARATGADLRLSGLGFTDAELAAVGRVPGVADVAPWADPQNADIVGREGTRTSVTVVATQPERLASVQQDLPIVRGFPADAAGRLAAATAAAGASGRLPVAVSEGFAAVGAELPLRVEGRPVPATVLATVPAFAGVRPGDAVVVADLAALRARSGLVIAPATLLARTSGAGPAESALRAAAPSVAIVSSLPQTAERSTNSPVVRAVRGGLVLALGVGAGLAALTAVLALLLGARERGRFVAHLRALGLSARQSAALVALEALPAGLAGLIAGVVAGLGLTWLLLPAADLRALTGSVDPPAIVAPAVTVLGVAGAFVVVVLLAVVVAVVAGRSVTPVEATRTVEAG